MPIYKYVTEERIDILENAHIRFTQPSEFNDPFEVYPYFKSFANIDFIDKSVDELKWDDYNKESITKQIDKALNEAYVSALKINPSKQTELNAALDYLKNHEILNSCKEILLREMNIHKPEMKNMLGSCFKLESGYREFMLKILRSALDKEIGILCLTEKYDNLPMWAHYANNHNGFVIEFDEMHTFFNQHNNPKKLIGHVNKVCYSLRRPEFMLYDSNLNDSENLDNWINNFLFLKSSMWEYEQEWRMIYTLRDCKNRIKNENHEICLVSLPIECIKGIILGCNISKESKQNIIALLKSNDNYSHIKLSHIELDEKEFRLNVIEDSI